MHIWLAHDHSRDLDLLLADLGGDFGIPNSFRIGVSRADQCACRIEPIEPGDGDARIPDCFGVTPSRRSGVSIADQ